MAASEAQRQALAKARAVRAANRAAATAGALHDPTGEAFANEGESPCLDPEIAGLVPLSEPLRPSVLDLAVKMLRQVEVRRGDGEIMQDRCLLCDDLFDSAVIRGIHHSDPIRCECACHELREALKAVA